VSATLSVQAPYQGSPRPGGSIPQGHRDGRLAGVDPAETAAGVAVSQSGDFTQVRGYFRSDFPSGLLGTGSRGGTPRAAPPVRRVAGQGHLSSVVERAPAPTKGAQAARSCTRLAAGVLPSRMVSYANPGMRIGKCRAQPLPSCLPCQPLRTSPLASQLAVWQRHPTINGSPRMAE
jgi:hypothetical protein